MATGDSRIEVPYRFWGRSRCTWRVACTPGKEIVRYGVKPVRETNTTPRRANARRVPGNNGAGLQGQALARGSAAQSS
jgi:hypothetical protein